MPRRRRRYAPAILPAMLPVDDSAAWLTLARTPGLSVAALAAAFARMAGARELTRASAPALSAAGLAPVSRDYLCSAAAAPQPQELAWLDGAGHYLLPCTDARFPPLLRELPDCPVALFVDGCVSALADPQLAVVGSRNPSGAGRDTAFEFAESLGLRGLGITSGLAQGIDSAAHQGALRAQGVTLGVLGTGIDVVYPPENAALCRDIRRQGALLSEYPLGAPPRRRHFPRRNRLIAGLCLGTLVIEAALRSGSLITARHAVSYGREVFAVPGSIYNPLSRGCHELIKAGAALVETPDDVLRELNFSAFLAGPSAALPRSATPPPPTAGMDKGRKILLDALGFDPADLDTLVVRTGFKPDAVSSMMLILELEGHVQAAPGGRYSRVANRRAGGER